ncbi:hypothetical protein CATRI_12980 [Corynebacterium atrinae]|uniref:SdpI family protein n=1 Tax=Corynebacterium atrinae TaxID=1336740 RepID=UPI0025B31D66|nr:SdpI family protein [Corynebacterium atrinae]WJY64641.1 hypothetical protein CATRI_12980 [Corynebacterium atrinae]
MFVVGLIFFALSAVLLVVGALATVRRLPGNSVIGLRVPEVRKSQEVWDGAHAVAGPFWLLAALILLFGGFISWVVSGWWSLVPLFFLIAAFMAVSVGANSGARMAVLMDEQAGQSSGGGCGTDCNCGESAPEKAPANVDLQALRRAAAASDE